MILVAARQPATLQKGGKPLRALFGTAILALGFLPGWGSAATIEKPAALPPVKPPVAGETSPEALPDDPALWLSLGLTFDPAAPFVPPKAPVPGVQPPKALLETDLFGVGAGKGSGAP